MIWRISWSLHDISNCLIGEVKWWHNVFRSYTHCPLLHCNGNISWYNHQGTTFWPSWFIACKIVVVIVLSCVFKIYIYAKLANSVYHCFNYCFMRNKDSWFLIQTVVRSLDTGNIGYTWHRTKTNIAKQTTQKIDA